MRKLLLILSIALFAQTVAGQVYWPKPKNAKLRVVAKGPGDDVQTPFGIDTLAFSAADLFYTPDKGLEQWHGGNDVNVPVQGTNTPRVNRYDRSFYWWITFEPTQDNYDFSLLRSNWRAAIQAGQKYGFGVVTLFPGPPDGAQSYNGGYSCYPLYLHNLMQAESPKDFKTNGTSVVTTNDVNNNMWVPNWNSESYLTRWGKLMRKLAEYIDTAADQTTGVTFKSTLQYMDIRGYGSWGEWHLGSCIADVNNQPTGTKATVASLKRIVDSVVVAFPNTYLMAMIAGLEGGATSFPNIRMDPQIGYYLLTQQNNAGPFGQRRDSYGDDNSYLNTILQNNPTIVSGYRFDTAIVNRWKRVPITGEPVNGVQMTDLPREVRDVHTNSMGNANYGPTQNTAAKDSIRLASKLMGYRVKLKSGSASTTITRGVPFSVTLNWSNTGLCPPYFPWNVTYELRNASNVTVWTATSSMVIKGFLPTGAASLPVTDVLTIPGSVSNGTYSLRLVIKDAAAFYPPFPLYNGNPVRQADGSYILRSGIIF